VEDYIVSCCSIVDLDYSRLQQLNVSCLNYHFEVDGIRYEEDFGKSLSIEDFYQKMINGADTKTSQITFKEFEDYFRDFLKQGKDIIHVTLSSGLSGTFNSANIAKRSLEEEFPDRKIYIGDSLSACCGSGMIVEKLVEFKQQGNSIDQAYQLIEEYKMKANCLFFSTDLTWYVKGGRVSKASGLVGTALKICPVLNIDDEGKLIPIDKIRTKKRAMKAVCELMMERINSNENYDFPCYIAHSNCLEDALELKGMIEEMLPLMKDKIKIQWVGTTIGSHTGPGTVGLFFWGNKK